MEQFLDTSSGIGDVIVMMEETEAVEDGPEPNKQHNDHDGSDAVTKKSGSDEVKQNKEGSGAPDESEEVVSVEEQTRLIIEGTIKDAMDRTEWNASFCQSLFDELKNKQGA
jgi:hypothetical protein